MTDGKSGTDAKIGRLSGCRALITGASRGIGRAIAEAYAREGADLFLTATAAGNLAETEAAVAGHGGRIVCHGAEISDEDQVETMFAAAIDSLGQVDIVVNNAGVYVGRPFTDYTTAEFDWVMKVNVYGVFHMMQQALRHMQGRKNERNAKIVNIASTAGKWESPNQAAYNASKHAVVAMTRCAALENAGAGINVNAICPGFVETDMIGEFKVHADRAGMAFDEFKAATLARVPIGRALDPVEIAHIAVYLGSAESDGMTGQTITISGGLRMG